MVGVFCTRSSLDRLRKSFCLVLDPQRLTDECFCPLYLSSCKLYNRSGCFLIKPLSCMQPLMHTHRQMHTHTFCTAAPGAQHGTEEQQLCTNGSSGEGLPWHTVAQSQMAAWQENTMDSQARSWQLHPAPQIQGHTLVL